MIGAATARATLIFALVVVQVASCEQMLKPRADRRSNAEQDRQDLGKAPPTVEPLAVRLVTPEDAAAINAAMPFTAPVGAPARPFNVAPGDDGERALTCLAAAVYYEAASESIVGKRAVAQVVLNRVRHPAFPNTVCGVVFQGAERVTGCQFTFTCDGSLQRVPSLAGLTMARVIAAEALRGRVEPMVGTATHYHASYVVPIWSANMDKIAQVGLHIFYRWKGGWGTPGAFRQVYGKVEPAIARLAALSPSHLVNAVAAVPTLPVPADVTAVGPVLPAAPYPGAATAPVSGSFLVALQPNASADSLLPKAREACARFKRCSYFGWVDPAQVAASAKLTANQRDSLSFSYERDDDLRRETTQWDCRLYQDRDRRSCLSRALLIDLQRDRAAK
jgi:spore germination cell wall hydrolase CwlJ-like protein